MSANSSVTTPGTLKSTTTSKPTTKLYELETNYTPIIAAVGAGFGGFIVFVCCMCVLQSWWLKKKKFTNVNSRTLTEIEKKKRKRELREARRQQKGVYNLPKEDYKQYCVFSHKKDTGTNRKEKHLRKREIPLSRKLNLSSLEISLPRKRTAEVPRNDWRCCGNNELCILSLLPFSFLLSLISINFTPKHSILSLGIASRNN